MKWGKFILIFQAIVTLLIGFVLFFQMMNMEKARLSQELSDKVNSNLSQMSEIQDFVDLKFRFELGSYLLVVISLVEMIIIFRLVD
jgi:hypothetical protein